jgi:hypothetical protein
MNKDVYTVQDRQKNIIDNQFQLFALECITAEDLIESIYKELYSMQPTWLSNKSKQKKSDKSMQMVIIL